MFGSVEGEGQVMARKKNGTASLEGYASLNRQEQSILHRIPCSVTVSFLW